MALVESAAAGILAGQANRDANFYQAGEGEGLGHAVIDGAFAGAHLGALFEELLYFGMNMEALGISGQMTCEFG